MVQFADPQAAEVFIKRLSERTLNDQSEFLQSLLELSPDPDRSLVRLDNWLSAVGNPSSVVGHLQQVLPLSQLLMSGLAVSTQIADLLVQNPELSEIALNPDYIASPPELDEMVSEIAALIATSSDFTHALDRLRFAKQKFHFAIALADLGDLWPQLEIWRALSNVAVALTRCTRDVVWKKFSADRNLTGECPVSIVAFGKLGGDELNYSSDIDLVYVLNDQVTDEIEREIPRFCESLGRAISNRMGRGALYRVDLRLRPFGSSGPIVSKMHAFRAYYERYAEAWERLAVIRSRVIAGSQANVESWEELRQFAAFASAPGAFGIEEVVNQRLRIEQFGSDEDLKRGPGGIRDIEFLTQVLQWIHHDRSNEITIRPTIAALNALKALHAIDDVTAQQLIRNYTYLRRVEHRCQIAHDLQTHSLPHDVSERRIIARTLGYQNSESLDAELNTVRTQTRKIYSEFVSAVCPNAAPSPRNAISSELGTHFVEWLDGIPNASAFFDSICDSQGAIHRLGCVLKRGPILLEKLKSDSAILESLISGEIEEESRIHFPVSRDRGLLGRAVSRRWLADSVRWCLTKQFDLGDAVSRLYDAILRHLVEESSSFSIVALGSYGSANLAPFSDADVVLICIDRGLHAEAERNAQDLLSHIREMRRYGSTLTMDLRLRPEGNKGLLVRTIEGLSQYVANDIETWEMFALGRARLVQGDPAALHAVYNAAYSRKLDGRMLAELLKMKERIESERVAPQLRSRHIKLGPGGIDDADWLVQLWTMFDPPEFDASAVPTFHNRCRYLNERGHLNAAETNALESSRHVLMNLRHLLALHGHDQDIVPENPDKLAKLALALELPDANALIARQHDACNTIRDLFLESSERLGQLLTS